MEILALVFSGISAAAAVVSAIAAFKAKTEVTTLRNQISISHSSPIKNNGDIKITNDGKNTGTIMGINTGEVNGR